MTIEEQRYKLQLAVDSSKSQKQRNEKGQFSTPFNLACDIVNYAISLLPSTEKLSVLEPACGMGVFFSALQNNPNCNDISGSIGFEIDPDYQKPSAGLWSQFGVDIRCADFLLQKPDRKFPLLISNPPYTRHHYLPTDIKHVLQNAVKEQTGLNISGLAGLYCYFMILSNRWLENGGISCWLVPSEFMDVNYGDAVRRFLLEKVDLLRIHRFDENSLQFKDALVSSSVVFFRNTPPTDKPVEFTFSGNISKPLKVRFIDRQTLSNTKKWNPLFKESNVDNKSDFELKIGDFFEVKRGIATGCNQFFIVDANTVERYDIPKEFLTPILPRPKKVQGNIIKSMDGLPVLDEKLFLFSSNEGFDIIRQKYSGVAQYLREGLKKKVNEGYICSRHDPWYSCEKRRPAPFVIPYMGRHTSEKQMFRFILNESDAIATNGYLMMYPRKEYAYLLKDKKILHDVWQQLNNIPMQAFERQGRTYGGGLHKIEPKELLNLPAGNIAKLLGNHIPWVA